MSTLSVGTYLKGEVPLDLVYGFTAFNGTAIDLTGYTVKWVATPPDGSGDVTVAGTLRDATAGTVAMAWNSNLTDAVGPWLLVCWVDDGTATLASATIYYDVSEATAPSF